MPENITVLLNDDQKRFYSLLSQYPSISVFWNKPKGECKIEALKKRMLGMPHSHTKCNKVTHWPDPDKITVLALLEIPLYAGKTSDSERTVLHRKTT